MATSKEYKDFILEQLNLLDSISSSPLHAILNFCLFYFISLRISNFFFCVALLNAV